MPAAASAPGGRRIHPGGQIHRRLTRAGLTGDAERREFTCDFLGRTPVASLTELNTDELREVNAWLARTSPDALALEVRRWRRDREHA